MRKYEMQQLQICMRRVICRVCVRVWGLCMCLCVCMMISPAAHLPAALLPAYTADLSALCSTPSSSSQRTKPRFTQLAPSKLLYTYRFLCIIIAEI